MHFRSYALFFQAMLVVAPSYAADLSQLDLTKIERRIVEEPEYKSQSPEYCLVVFGMKAERRVWLVRDGNALHVDLNGNGILGEAGERFTSRSSSRPSFDVPLTSKATKSTNRLLVSMYSTGTRLRFLGSPMQYVGFAKATKPHFGRAPATAPIINFNGPLSLERYAEPVTLPPNPTSSSYRKTSLRLMVGSKGLGEGTFAALHCKSCKHKGDLAATIQYPAQLSNQKGNTQTVRLKFYG